MTRPAAAEPIHVWFALLRGSLAQTLERRNSRVLGTLLGCVVTLGLLSAHLPPLVLIAWLTLAQGVAHGFALRIHHGGGA